MSTQMTSPSSPDPGIGERSLAEEAISGRARVSADDLIDADLLEAMLARVDEHGLRLTGEGGCLPALMKKALERGLAAELSGHLGYEKGDPAGRGSPNSRNGTTPKDRAHRDRRDPVGRAQGPQLRLRAAAGAQGCPPAGRRAGRDDHQPLRRRDDGGRHRLPPRTHPGRGAVTRDVTAVVDLAVNEKPSRHQQHRACRDVEGGTIGDHVGSCLGADFLVETNP